MAHISPFKGVLYDPRRITDMARVVAPPYDVIDAEFQKTLHARYPNNVIQLELGLDRPDDGPTQNRYTRAASSLRDWLATGILRRDSEPAIYPYTIEYRAPSGESGAASRVLKGFLSTVELEEFGTGRIFPHENTRGAAKADRLKLLEACRANFSPIFSLFSDPEARILPLIEKSVNADKPRVDFRDDEGFRHRLWSITDRTVLSEIVTAMKSKPLFIADGHHRYETALTYRNLRRQQAGSRLPAGLQPYDGVLMLFSSLEDPGLTVLPTHRVLRTPLPPIAEIKERLHEDFKIEEFPFQANTEAQTRRQFLHILRSRGQNRHAFGLALQDISAYVLLTLRSVHRISGGASAKDRLDVSILHNQILPPLLTSRPDEQTILYTKDDDEALDLVRRGTAKAALLLNPTKVSEVRAVAAAGERMPHKSTYFFPKPLTGLVMNVMEMNVMEE
ncbi:MAG: DUF1015 domain-containing protein [Nitrospirae bacterium]|nr:DUF1015 domain-containing protein [Nitrospirota bacterium]